MLNQLRLQYLFTAGANARLYHELAMVVDDLCRRSIELIALKGAHIAKEVYEDIGLRPMSDLDLLVHLEDVPQAEEVLLGRGYVLVHPERREWYMQQHFHLGYRKGSVLIELHWDLAPPGWPLSAELCGFWSRSREIRLSGSHVRVLAPHDLLVHLCVHMACHHGFAVRLRPICDVAWCLHRYGPTLDWNALAQLAEDAALQRSLYACCLLANRLLDAPLPTAFYEHLDKGSLPETAVPTIARYVLDTSLSVQVPAGLQRAIRSKGAVARLETLVRSVVPPAKQMRQIYSIPPRSPRLGLYYFYRPLDLLRRKTGDLAKILLQTRSARDAMARERDKVRIEAWFAPEESI